MPSKDWRGDGEWVETENFHPLHDIDYESAAQEWLAEFDQWRAGAHPHQDADTPYYWEYSTPPDRESYRERKWTAEEATHYQIYETVTEGTPVSPVFASLDELVEWCVGQGYSRRVAEGFATKGWVPSMVMDLQRGIFAEGIEIAGLE